MEDIKDSEIRIIGKDETFDKNTVPVNPSAESSKDSPMLERKIVDRGEGRYDKGESRWSIRKVLILFVLFVIVANVLFYIFKGCMYQPPVEARMNGVEELENAMFDPEVPEGQFESEVSSTNTMILDNLSDSSSASAVIVSFSPSRIEAPDSIASPFLLTVIVQFVAVTVKE